MCDRVLFVENIKDHLVQLRRSSSCWCCVYWQTTVCISSLLQFHLVLFRSYICFFSHCGCWLVSFWPCVFIVSFILFTLLFEIFISALLCMQHIRSPFPFKYLHWSNLLLKTVRCHLPFYLSTKVVHSFLIFSLPFVIHLLIEHAKLIEQLLFCCCCSYNIFFSLFHNLNYCCCYLFHTV